MENNTVSSIQHIILSGGGHVMFQEYAILRDSNLAGFWNFKNLKSIYGTSAGAIIGLYLALVSIFDEEQSTIEKEWEILDNYLINRPWQNLFKIDLLTIIQSINKEGILLENVAIETFAPIFKAKDLSPNINMIDLYNITNIELHFFTVDMDTFEIVDISHRTHPEWSVVSAVYASSCLPILFSPYKKDGKIYTDGGVLINYPLSQFLKNNPTVGSNEIFAIKIVYNSSPDIKKEIDESGEDSENKSLTEYKYDSIENKPTYIYDSILKILMKMFEFIEKHNNNMTPDFCLKNEISIYGEYSNILYDIYLASNFSEERKKLIAMGSELWKEFLEKNE